VAIKQYKKSKLPVKVTNDYGTPNEDSDIDIFLLKEGLNKDNIRTFELEASKRLRDIKMNYKTNGIDVLSTPTSKVYEREDYFYKDLKLHFKF
jgi:hypothetical protein